MELSEISAPPRQLVFEVASVCNLRCPQCWIGLRWTERSKSEYLMPMDLFYKVCDEASGFVKHTYLHLWGEPTLHKKLPEMIKRVKEFSTIDLATHGLFIDEELAIEIAKCDTISVSIEGVTQEVYEKYRVGGRLDKAMHGLKLLSEAAPGRVSWTYVVFKSNEHQTADAVEVAKSLSVRLGLKPPIFWDKSKMSSEMPSDESLRRYVYRDGSWQLKADRFKCTEFWTTVYVLPSGNVITCCYDGNSEYVMGNVKESSVMSVWNGEPYRIMRRNHLQKVLNPLCQKHCNLP